MNGLQLVILNHTRQQLHEPWALSDKVFGLKWQTLIQGGFGPCEFNMKWWPGADRILNEGRIVLVKYGIRTVYAGRLADPKIERHSVNIGATTQYEQIGQSDGDAYDDGTTFYRALADVKVGDSGGSTLTAGLVFESVNVPRNAEILSATLTLAGSKIGSPVVRFYGEAADNAALYTAGATWPKDRNKTSAHVDPNMGSWTSTDVTILVQEIVDRSGWSSGNRMGMILADNGSPTNAYLSITAYDSVPALSAQLTIIYKTEDVVDLSFVLHYFQRPELTRANADLVVYAMDVVGGKLALTQNLEKLVNSVKARYGSGPSYTAAAEDADSIAKYDKRMNNPGELNAGESVTVTVANKVRDAYLEENKDPKWETDKLTLLNVRNRYGQRIHPSTVRAGRVVWFPEFATFDEDDARVFYIMQTEYNADKNQLAFNTTSVEKSTAMWLAQMKAKYSERI